MDAINRMASKPESYSILIMSSPLWGRHIVFALSVYPSIRLSVCHTLFPLNNSSTL